MLVTSRYNCPEIVIFFAFHHFSLLVSIIGNWLYKGIIDWPTNPMLGETRSSGDTRSADWIFANWSKRSGLPIEFPENDMNTNYRFHSRFCKGSVQVEGVL
jgi:hypothetical protein